MAETASLFLIHWGFWASPLTSPGHSSFPEIERIKSSSSFL